MPIYEFVCPDCGWEFEELLRNSAEADSTPCPACDSKYVLKKISVFSAKTNGSGFATGMYSNAYCGPSSRSTPGSG